MGKYTKLARWEMLNKLDAKDDRIEKLKAQLADAEEAQRLLEFTAIGRESRLETAEAQLAKSAETYDKLFNAATETQSALLDAEAQLIIEQGTKDQLFKTVSELEAQLAEIESMKGYDGHFMDEDNRRIATIVYTHQQVQAILNREKQ